MSELDKLKQYARTQRLKETLAEMSPQERMVIAQVLIDQFIQRKMKHALPPPQMLQ